MTSTHIIPGFLLICATTAHGIETNTFHEAPSTLSSIQENTATEKTSSTKVVTLESVLASTVDYPAILSAEADINASKGDKRAADMQRLPSLSASAGYNGSSKISPVLQIQQPLWTGGKITGQIEQAEQIVASAEAKKQETSYNIELRAVSAWQNLINTQNSIKINEEVLSQLHSYRKFMERRVAAGVSPEIELQLVLTRIEQIQSDIRGAEALNQVAKIQLQQLTNYTYTDAELDNTPSFDDQVTSAKTWFNHNIAPNINEFLTATVATYPSVLRAQKDAAVLKATQKIKNAAQYPSINLGYQYTINRNDSLNNPNDNRITLGITYQPGAGLSAYETAKAAAIRAEGALNAINAAKLDILESLNSDIQDAISSQQREDMLNNSVDASNKVLESYKRQFVAGKRTWFDVMNALRELTQNRLSVVTTKTTLIISAQKLMVKSGLYQPYNGA